MSIWYKLGAVLLTLGLLAGLLSYSVRLRTKLVLAEQATRTAQDALKRQQATLTLREKQRAASDRAAASARASLAAALAVNQEWAATAVPKEVQDDLCKTLRCAGASHDGLRDGAANIDP